MNFKLNTHFMLKNLVIHITISALFGFMTYLYIRNASKMESGPICQTEKNTDKYLNTDEKEKNTDKYLNIDENDGDELIILLWSWPARYTFPLDQCSKVYGVKGCTFTLDRSWYNRSHVVMINFPDVRYSKGMGPKDPRPENQRWVWYNWESPRHSPNLDDMDNKINLTMSYKTGVDIYIPYGGIRKMKEPQNYTIPKKTKLVAWLVSNWDPTMVRVAYYKELKKHVNVDMFGKRDRPLTLNETTSLVSQYKFYLAFENSLAIDYISEKFWRNALMSGTVPVVLGTTRANYEQFMPGDAFIHVNDFPSAKDLAAYLHHLDSNDEQYKRYFRWRKWYQPFCDEGDWAKHYCIACKALKQSPIYKTFPNISKWYINPETLWG